MSKALLIGILAAVLLGIAGLVWWQAASYDKREQHLKEQLENEHELRLKNQPFVPEKTSGSDDRRGLMGAYL
jgi:uncharacterized protein YxeA